VVDWRFGGGDRNHCRPFKKMTLIMPLSNYGCTILFWLCVTVHDQAGNPVWCGAVSNMRLATTFQLQFRHFLDIA